MVARFAGYAVVGLLGAVCGWVASEATSGAGDPVGGSAPAAPVAPAAPAASAALSAPASPSADDCVCGTEREMLVAAARRGRAASLAHPIAWPEDPGIHAPEVVEARLKEAIEACGEGVEFHAMECTEPPCIGLVRAGSDVWPQASALGNCPVWTEVYGENAYLMGHSSDCDGDRVNRVIISPVWPLELTPQITHEQYRQRWNNRVRRIRDTVCDEASEL